MSDRKEESVTNHINWALSKGASLSKKVKFVRKEEYGEGVCLEAIDNLPKNYKILSIPHSLSLGITTCRSGPFKEELEKLLDQKERVPTTSLILILVFLYEHAHLETSPWKDYFATLPALEFMLLPFFWSVSFSLFSFQKIKKLKK